MKHHFWGTIVVMGMLGLLAGCAGIQTMDTSNLEPVSIAELGSSPEKYGLANGPPQKDVIVKIDQGESLPVFLSLQSPLISLEPGQNRIHFNRDVYVYLSSKGILISPDGNRWAEFSDKTALKELFDIQRGEFGIGFGASQEKGAHISLSAKGS